MAEERERTLKATDDAEPDVEGHRKIKRDDDVPTVERERVIRADEDDSPDVEAHRLQR
jgi:hypothetical protein